MEQYEVQDAEQTCTAAWTEIERRRLALNSAYPFSLSKAALLRTPLTDCTTYSMLVLLGGLGAASLEKKKLGETAKLFEKLSALALEQYTGGKVFRIGHPREKPLPSSFAELLQLLSRETGENLSRAKPLASHTKDCRADLIAWRPFGDGRGGQLVVLAQCAIGKHWKSKLTECNVQLWGRYLEFISAPLRAFVVPFVEPNEDLWLEYGTLGGIPIDRVRLMELISRTRLPSDLARDVKSWSKAELANLIWED